ncbi:hypothetical protein HYY72_00695 [Candidatus Woesearchaeota archaeon]|nr:hypothetical protein [Candidatus Woesearchaeota archaeon]
MRIRKFLPAGIAGLLALPAVHAHCPLCTAAVGTAAVTANYLGLDPSIIGIFIGAFGISTGLWIGLKLKRFIPMQAPLIVIGSFALTVLPLLALIPETAYIPVLVAGSPGSTLNRVYWMNKLLLGSIIGGVASLLGFWIHTRIKSIRGKVLFPFQGVAITVAILLSASLAMYLIMR